MNTAMPLTDAEKRTRVFSVSSAFVLLSIIILALVYLATGTTTAATATLSFAGGVSNIFLPCTLPLAFVIVPMSMGQGYRKGLMMAVLFGLGLTITLGFYGVATAVLGNYLGLDQATRIMYVIAGIAALLFGLSELKLISLSLPAYTRTPKFIEERSDYLKVFFLGLFLGNAGVGCPNPITYVLLVYVASTGSLWDGFWLMWINGIGRALPLIFLSVLGILGVNALPAAATEVLGAVAYNVPSRWLPAPWRWSLLVRSEIERARGRAPCSLRECRHQTPAAPSPLDEVALSVDICQTPATGRSHNSL